MDSSALLDRDITSREYILRYAEDVLHDQRELLAIYAIDHAGDLGEALFEQELFDGDVHVAADGIQLFIGEENLGLNYPFTHTELREAIADLDAEVEANAEPDDGRDG